MLWKRWIGSNSRGGIRPITTGSDMLDYVNLQVVDSKGNKGIVGINRAIARGPSQGEAWHKRPPAGRGGLGPSSASQTVWVLP